MNAKFRDLISGRTALVALGTMAPALSFAQAVTDPFDTALASVTTKVTSYAGALVGVAAISVVFMVAIKYVKKLPKAS